MEIKKEKEYDEQIEKLTKNYSRMDDLESGIDWALYQGPDNIPGVVNVEDQFYVWVTEEFSSLDIPKVRIVYKYDGDYTVNLISIESY